ncbi:DUF817 domain-containing protein [Pectobacterium polonicum]|uniref:DUF817 domain-containing protein n=1 Tax=Pectobacterium polonicum TaxID=2485124 RepID=UPI0037541F5B
MMSIRMLALRFRQRLEKGMMSTKAEGLTHFFIEFLYFSVKEIRACTFVGLFSLAIFSIPQSGWLSIPRYDLLFIAAILIQGLMVASKLETWSELKAITLFHLIGFALEIFKTSSSIHSWSYPDFAYSKLFGVPLFAGFMYASIGSYIIQSWRLFDIKIRHHPPYWQATLVSVFIYINFFTHHYIPDYRWYITALVLGLYSRTTIIFTPYNKERNAPLSLLFVSMGFFIWLAENISTFLKVWRYPEQSRAWSMVSIGKWSSWTLMTIMTFTIIIYLKDFKKSIHISE